MKPYKGRREDQRLLTGQGQFTSDFNLEGQLYGWFLRSDRAHAAIRSIDTAAARASPGVRLVLNGGDFSGKGFRTLPPMARLPGRNGMQIRLPERLPLAHGKA